MLEDISVVLDSVGSLGVEGGVGVLQDSVLTVWKYIKLKSTHSMDSFAVIYGFHMHRSMI